MTENLPLRRLSVVCGTAAYLLFVVQLPICCLWCSCLSAVCGAATYLLFVVQLPICCLWCSYLSAVCGAATYLLFVVQRWRTHSCVPRRDFSRRLAASMII